MFCLNDIASMHYLLTAVGKVTAIDKKWIVIDRSRDLNTTTARKISMYLAREELKLSYYKLAEYFDRDPTTCRSNCISIAKEIKARPRGELANKIKEIRSNFR